MGFQLKEIVAESLLVVDHRLVEVGQVHVEVLFSTKEFVAFFKDGNRQVVKASRLEGVAEASDDGSLVGKFLQDVVEVTFRLVVLALQGVDVHQVCYGSGLNRVFLGERLELFLGMVEVLQLDETLYVLLEIVD